jgi:hypothetical protein
VIDLANVDLARLERGKISAATGRAAYESIKRAVELTLFVQGAFRELVGNWQDRTNYQWSEDYCNDPGWAAAINNQWRVVLTVHSSAGELFSARADCH